MKYDLKVLQNYGIKVEGALFDTMIAHYLINPDMRHNMDLLSETYFGYLFIPQKTDEKVFSRAVAASLSTGNGT